MSLEQLQVAVAKACAADGVWASRFAAAVRAALAFAVANPTAARALIDARDGRPEDTDSYREMLTVFSSQLRDGSQPGERIPTSSDEALAKSIAGVVSGYLYRGSAAGLEEIAPHLVYLALLPYVGFDEARQWSYSPFN